MKCGVTALHSGYQSSMRCWAQDACGTFSLTQDASHILGSASDAAVTSYPTAIQAWHNVTRDVTEFMYRDKHSCIPSMRTFNVSLSMLIVVKSTKTEKRNVHIGSATFQSGCNNKCLQVYISFSQ